MICKKCRHCGLCEGDGKEMPEKKMLISSDGLLPFVPRGGAILDGRIFIAVDIGTTTIAASAYSASTQKCLASASSVNPQRKFGADVVSRIQAASTASGRKSLGDSVVSAVNSLLSRLLALSALRLPRGFRAEIEGMAITGNTAMLSIAFGLDCSSLAVAPFSPPSLFGEDFCYGDFLRDCPVPFESVPRKTPLYVPPCVSSFFGADAICALTACGFGEDDSERMLSDVGTNCEMALQTKTGKILCTASAAGPAFEGYGIKCGMGAAEGAIAASRVKSDTLGGKTAEFDVIGGGKARGICGTGLLSSLGTFLKLGILSADGAISGFSGEIMLLDGVSLSQSDIRAVQLAKSAVRTGLDYLLAQGGREVSAFFLAGGFGTALNPADASAIGMIPNELAAIAVPAGNAALSGAAAILLKSEMRDVAEKIASKAECVNLAETDGFQERFIGNINFPKI